MNDHVTTHAYHEWLSLAQERIALDIRAQAERATDLSHEFQTQVHRARTLCDETWRLLKQFPPDFNFADGLPKYSQVTQTVL